MLFIHDITPEQLAEKLSDGLGASRPKLGWKWEYLSRGEQIAFTAVAKEVLDELIVKQKEK